jgi:preprotein translocase subunit SecA
MLTRKPGTMALLKEAMAVMVKENEFKKMSVRDLDLKIRESADLILLNRADQEDILTAMAVLREVAFRILGQKPYYTRVAGALGILKNCIVEMPTGEGKTLTAALAAAISGWRGKGCHVVTSNDYLAARDAETLKNFYRSLGLTCASIVQEAKPEERWRAYSSDITYLTSKESTADFLRDRLALGRLTSHCRVLVESLSGGQLPKVVQRGLYCAIIDEADSVLCDGGSTPLIISAQSENAPSADQYLKASQMAETMKVGQDFLINRVFREVKLTDSGRKKVSQSLGPNSNSKNMAGHTAQNGTQTGGWAGGARARELVTQALEAREFFQESVHYVIKEGKVVIVDEATGRIMPDHEWRDGLHQAVSAKENLEIVPPRATSAQTTFQDFFLRYSILGGMTGTAWEARGEFRQFYRLAVTRIPTYRPCQRRVSYRAFFRTTAEKNADIVRLVAKHHKTGRPVLVGTRSIEASEDLSRALTSVGIPHEVLNAVQHQREAEIVAKAGVLGAVTVATNMAGRGTDIKLAEGVRELGGLKVILTEMHSSGRIDRQLHGRCGRQGDPGSVAEIICLEDALFKTSPLWLMAFFKFLLSSPVLGQTASKLAWRLASFRQWLDDRRSYQQRKQMIKSNQQFADLISYSGKQD